MMTLSRIAGVIALLTALCSPPAYAQESTPAIADNQPTGATIATNQDAIVFESNAIVQTLPDYSAVWLDGRVSFVGGEITTSEQQYMYAEAKGIPVVQTSNFDHLKRTGHLVRLSGPHIGFTEVFTSGNSEAYVLPSTLLVLRNLSEAYNSAGCGRLMVNDVLRLDDRGKPRNASPYSVHSRGMAVDLRINNLSSRCYGVLEQLLQIAEANGEADATHEHNPLHFHVVVVPELQPRRILLEARRESSEEQTGQSN